uniref:Uncharacterized protein n=1 Tax=Acrobeloides nanus TaxID=290746 RepID=A0A914D7D0_9BILA
MFLVITIIILFIYTLILIAFFMGWCTLVPKIIIPRREIPFSSVKSPRRNTIFADFESFSSPSQSLEILHRKLSLFPDDYNTSTSNLSPTRPNDYLHPKYSLPPTKIDISEHLWEYDQLLRTPASRKSSRNSRESIKTAKLIETHVPTPSPSIS